MSLLKLLMGAGSVINILTGKTIYFYGDSITFGYNLSAPSKRFSSRLCAIVGATEVNFGVNGQTLQNAATYGTNHFSVSDVPVYNNNYFLFMAYGVNDIGLNAPTMTPAAFETQYQSAITTMINTKGWPSNRIVLLTPFYYNEIGYEIIADQFDLPTPTVERHIAYAVKVKNLATTNNCKFVDIYTAMRTYSDPDSLLSDNIHPSEDEGCPFIANFLSVQNYY